MLELVEAPAIFVANHSSHVDTGLLLSILPPRFRHKTVVAGAADYFFDRRWKAHLFALGLGAIPIERHKVNRKSVDTATGLLDEGWNLIIFPEGGRSPDGWFQPMRGGAAYLATRTGRPVVPVHIEGTYRILPRGGKRPAAQPDAHHLRVAADHRRRGRGRPPPRGEDRRGARRPGRRGAHRLVVGTATRAAGHDALAARARRLAVAPCMGARPRPPRRRRGRRRALGAGRSLSGRPGRHATGRAAAPVRSGATAPGCARDARRRNGPRARGGAIPVHRRRRGARDVRRALRRRRGRRAPIRWPTPGAGRRGRVTGQGGTVGVGAEDEPGPGPFGPVPGAVAHSVQHAPQGPDSGAETRDGGVVLEAAQRAEHHRVGAVGSRAATDGLGGELPHGSAPRSLDGVDVEQSHPGMRTTVGTGERPTDQLVAGAHGEHDGAALHGARRARPSPQALGRLHLGPVLTAAQAVNVGPAR